MALVTSKVLTPGACAVALYLLSMSISISAESPAAKPAASLPLTFVANQGQLDSRVRFYHHSQSQSYYFTSDRVVIVYQASAAAQALALHLRFVGARGDAALEALQPTTGVLNTYVGDRSRWRSGLRMHREVQYRDVWPGIDVRFAGRGQALKYEFVAQPGADLKAIRLAYDGANRVALDASGNLVLDTAIGRVVDLHPTAYQVIDGRRREVPVRYALAADGTQSFAVGRGYDAAHALVIDPELKFSTFLGGSANEESFGIAVGGRHTFVTGSTRSPNFPTTAGPIGSPGSDEVFVSKFSADGSELVFSTLLGGSGSDVGEDVALDAAHAFVVGETESADFPVTPGALDDSYNGNEDAFVAKLDTNHGGLIYSTFLGGSQRDQARGVDTSGGQAYVTGETGSADFPTTAGAPGHGASPDAFVVNLDAQGSRLQYARVLGGTFEDVGRAISVRGSEAWVTGFTDSPDFPTTPGAWDQTYGGTRDVFVTKFNPHGDVEWSTYLGDLFLDESFGIAVDGQGNASVTGTTTSPDFPTTAGAYDTSFNGGSDVFVSKVGRDGSALVFSTFLGGAAEETARGIDLEGSGNANAGNILVAGSTNSGNYPVTADAFQLVYQGGTSDAIVSSLSEDGSTLVYSTYLGGLNRDQARGIAVHGHDAYVTGFTTSASFPVTPQAYDPTHNGERDVFVTAFDMTRGKKK